MTANLDDKLASRFLKILDEKAKSFTYQTFHDTEAKEKNPALAHIIAGPAHDRLLDLHERGAGIYVTVNETSDKAIRRDANIIRVRAVSREADAANLPELPIEPSLIVKTSPGHSHEYFLVADDWPADAQGRADFAAVMERMVETYKSDKNAKDLCRVLRVPGFLHRKHEPHLIRISKPNGGGEQVRRYTRAEILAAFPRSSGQRNPKSRSGTTGRTTTATTLSAPAMRSAASTPTTGKPGWMSAWRSMIASAKPAGACGMSGRPVRANTMPAIRRRIGDHSVVAPASPSQRYWLCPAGRVVRQQRPAFQRQRPAAVSRAESRAEQWQRRCQGRSGKH